MSTRVTVVIVSWNVRAKLSDCLISLRASHEPLHVVVVDNGSTDGTREYLAAAFPEVTLIANDGNVGFAAATNQGLAQATGDACLLLNPDTEVPPMAVATLLACLEARPEVGAVGPLIRGASGQVDYQGARRFPTPWTQALDWSGLAHRWPRLAWHLLPRWDHQASRDVACLSGACVLLRRRALADVGLLDPGYFLYAEDMDLFRRMARAGWVLHYCADTAIVHHGGQSSGQTRTAAGLASLASHHRFFVRHYGPGSARLYRRLMHGICVAKWLAYSLAASVSPDAARRPLLWERAQAYRVFARWSPEG